MPKVKESKRKPVAKHWYFMFYEECAVCGRSTYAYRERRFTPRPEEYEKRHQFSQSMCRYCMME